MNSQETSNSVRSANDLLPLTLEVLIDLVHESLGAEVVSALGDLVAVDADGEVLGHVTGLDGVDDGLLEGGRELGEELVVVELCSVGEAASPGEDRGNGVGGGGLTLLPLSVVAGDGAVGSLSLDDAVLVEEHRGHQAQGAVALRDDIALHISVVVLAGPHDAAVPLDNLGDHVVDQAVLVVDAACLELRLVLLLVHLHEDVLEEAVVLLKDGVLGRQLQRVAAVEGVLEAGGGESLDGLGRVVHAHQAAGALEGVGDGLEGVSGGAIVGDELHDEFAWLVDDGVGGHVLVTVGVTADDDGLGPAGHEAGHVGADDGLTEDGTIEDVSDGAVGALPHLLELELLNAVLVGGDGGALNADLVLLDGVGRLHSDLVVCGVSVLNGEIVVLEVDVDVRSDVLNRKYNK